MIDVECSKLHSALFRRFVCRLCGSRKLSYSGEKILADPIAPVCMMIRPKQLKTLITWTNKTAVDSNRRIDQNPTGNSKKKNSMKLVRKL